jgi:rubrerythrin
MNQRLHDNQCPDCSAASGLHRCPRRTVLKAALLALLPWGLLVRPRPAAAQAYPETIAALANALQRELEAHHRYLESAKKATAEGYEGIAYLFTAFAASEQIHARNFERIMTSLGGKPNTSTPSPALSDTKQNLITAAADELDTIDNLYPETLKRLKPENHAEAITYVGYALQSEKQHRDMIQRVQRYTASFFDRVVKTINELTAHYFVCQVCGSTLKTTPMGNCPICHSPSTNYRLIDAPA